MNTRDVLIALDAIGEDGGIREDPPVRIVPEVLKVAEADGVAEVAIKDTKSRVCK